LPGRRSNSFRVDRQKINSANSVIKGGKEMKRFMTFAAAAMLSAPFAHAAMAQSMSKDALIAQAVLAAPESLRAGATVVNYDAKGNAVVLRKGTNGIVCTPDQPGGIFSVSCYGQALLAQREMEAKEKGEGKDPKTIQADVQAAIQTGKLQRVPMGTTMYSLSGRTQAMAKGMWVVLMPGMTASETGLPTQPTAEGTPWLMRAGTPAAHIHIPQHSAGAM
jgi:hypothetical protein